MRFACCRTVLHALSLAVIVTCGTLAWGQQLVTDAPVAKPGGTAYVGRYTSEAVFSAGPTFHFTAPVTITSVSYDPGPGDVQELSVRALHGCAPGVMTAAGTVCAIDTAIASRFPGTRYGMLRIRTTGSSFTLPVEWESIGAQIAVTPGTVSTPSAFANVLGNSLATDARGNIYVSGGGTLRKLDVSTGEATVVAGGGAAASSVGSPVDVTVSPAGDMYFVSATPAGNDVVMKVDSSSGDQTTLAAFGGGHTSASSSAEQAADGAVTVDAQGNVYITSVHDHSLFVVPGGGGAARVLVGTSPDGSQACNAALDFSPVSLAVSGGNVYFVSHSAVYRVSADTETCHTPSLVAGTGLPGNSGDGGLAVKAAIGGITGLAIDAAGDLYIADATSGAVRMVSAATGVIRTVAGTGSALPNVTVGAGLSSLALDARGNLYVLSARGAVQKIDVSFGTLHYLPAAIGYVSTDSPQGAVFANIGNADLASTASSLVLPSGGFAENPTTTTCGRGNATNLQSGASCSFGIDFAPNEAGVSSGILSFANTAVYLQGSSASATTTKPSYTAWVQPGSVMVQEGGSSTASFVFAPTGGFRGTVTFACANLPTGTLCSFAPARLTANGSDTQQASTLTVSMLGASSLASAGGTSGFGFALTAMSGAVMLLVWLTLRRRGSLSLPLLSLLLLLCTCVGGVTGCGAGGRPQTLSQSVSTTVKIVSTSATDGTQQTTSFVLTVQ